MNEVQKAILFATEIARRRVTKPPTKAEVEEMKQQEPVIIDKWLKTGLLSNVANDKLATLAWKLEQEEKFLKQEEKKKQQEPVLIDKWLKTGLLSNVANDELATLAWKLEQEEKFLKQEEKKRNEKK